MLRSLSFRFPKIKLDRKTELDLLVEKMEQAKISRNLDQYTRVLAETEKYFYNHKDQIKRNPQKYSKLQKAYHECITSNVEVIYGISQKLFLNIKRDDFTSDESDARDKCSNFVNNLQRKFISEILIHSAIEPYRRRLAIERLLEMTRQFINLKDWQTLYIIKAALSHPSIDRLKQTKGGLSKNAKKILAELDRLTDPNKPELYDASLNQRESAVIPSVFMCLNRTTVLNEGIEWLEDTIAEQKQLGNDGEVERLQVKLKEKKQELDNYYNKFKKLQNEHSSHIKLVDEDQLKKITTVPTRSTEVWNDSAYRLSLAVEPRNADFSKVEHSSYLSIVKSELSFDRGLKKILENDKVKKQLSEINELLNKKVQELILLIEEDKDLERKKGFQLLKTSLNDLYKYESPSKNSLQTLERISGAVWLYQTELVGSGIKTLLRKRSGYVKILGELSELLEKAIKLEKVCARFEESQKLQSEKKKTGTDFSRNSFDSNSSSLSSMSTISISLGELSRSDTGSVASKETSFSELPDEDDLSVGNFSTSTMKTQRTSLEIITITDVGSSSKASLIESSKRPRSYSTPLSVTSFSHFAKQPALSQVLANMTPRMRRGFGVEN